jgi:hypothetical protein
LYNTPNCEWCMVNLNTQVHEDLEHCITACPAHTVLRHKARLEVAQIATKLSVIPVIPTVTADDWLGTLAKPPRGSTKEDQKARASIQITLLLASHEMWINWCKYHNKRGLTNATQRKIGRPAPAMAGARGVQRNVVTGSTDGTPSTAGSERPAWTTGPPPIRMVRRVAAVGT